MLQLNLSSEPQWLELVEGVRVQVRPLTTALMVSTRSDPLVAEIPEAASDEERAVIFAQALGRRAILDWEGVGDMAGEPMACTPKAVDQLLDIWPIFEAWQERYVSRGLLLEQEKNASAPSPSGTTAGATATAKPARKSARSARRK